MSPILSHSDPRRENSAMSRAIVFFRERVIVRYTHLASSSNKNAKCFRMIREQQYCVKAFHKIRGPAAM